MITPRIKATAHLATLARPSRRSRRGACLRVEPLEGRALLATAAFDPTFGQAGIVSGLLDTGTSLNDDNAAAVAVDANGKTVVVGYAGFGGDAKFTVRRFNANGSLDTTFGTNGETDPPLPGTSSPGYTDPAELSIGANGSIALVTRTFGSSTTSTVVKLTSSGQLDTTFGTNGIYSLADGNGSINDLYSVAVQPDGKIIATGVQLGSSSNYQLLAIRLTTTGTLDNSFAGTGIQTLSVPGATASSPSTNANVQLIGSSLAVASSGQIYLGTNLFRTGNTSDLANSNGVIARLNADGTLDTSFAAAGYLALPSDVTNTLNAIAVGADNKLVVAGKINATSPTNSAVALPTTPFLIRYLTGGAADPTFHAIPISAVSTQTGLREVFTSVAIGTDGTITAGGYRLTTYYGSGTPYETNPQLIAAQFTATGQVNTTFGVHGQMTVTDPAYPNAGLIENAIKVALTPSNNVVLLGTIFNASNINQLGVLARLTPTLVLNNATNDFDGDGKSDITAELTTAALYAYRKSNGTGDVVQQFGQPGVGASIPVTGDFDGDGQIDFAVYLPALGALAYRSFYGGSDVIDFFGPKGTGNSIPAMGDYDGDGRTDVAVYIPAQGRFAIQPTGGGGNYYVSFGTAGIGQSIPVPGDYDGDGKTDLAVYIPSQGALYYRPSMGGADVKVAFGPSGIGASIPAPGDYDGDGKTDVALYLPGSGAFAIHPSSGVANILIPFGASGTGNSVPAPGDYDGDGKTDAAVYLPTLGEFAYRPSGGGGDVLQGFGTIGYGKTIPATANVYAQVIAAPSLYPQGGTGSSAAPAVLIPLTDDVTTPTTARKKATLGNQA